MLSEYSEVIELENSIQSEMEEREKSVTLMKEFKRDGGDVIKKLRESLHTVTNKYRQEVDLGVRLIRPAFSDDVCPG